MAINNNLFPKHSPKTCVRLFPQEPTPRRSSEQAGRALEAQISRHNETQNELPNHLIHLYFRLAVGQLTSASTPSRSSLLLARPFYLEGQLTTRSFSPGALTNISSAAV